MRKLIRIFPSDYDWSGAVGDGLAFGVGAAVFMRLVPPILRAVVAVAARIRSGFHLDRAQPLPSLKIFGQRR